MTVILGDPDQMWFAQRPTRRFHIRPARAGESENEFMALGPHETRRRQVILWKVPGDVAPQFRAFAGKVLKVPFLSFADEAIRDDDETLGPMLNEIMQDAARREGMTA